MAMKFLLDPTSGALVPEAAKKGAEITAQAAFDGLSDIALMWIGAAGKWLLINGLPLIAEGFLIWGLICFLVACSGSGKWMEKGARAVVMSVMVGLVNYAL